MSVLAWLFVVYVGLLLPCMAWRSSRRARRLPELPPRAKVYASTALFEGTLLAFAWIAAHRQGIQLFPVPAIGPLDAVVGVAWVALKYLRFWSVLRRPEALGRRRVLGHVAPRSLREVAGYLGMVTVAAVAEEAAYRGVLFQLGLYATGSFWIAGLASALVFGLAHLTQGRRPAAVAGALGFGNQVVVLLTGSLWVAIAAHFTYDALAGVAAGRLERTAEADAGTSGTRRRADSPPS